MWQIRPLDRTRDLTALAELFAAAELDGDRTPTSLAAQPSDPAGMIRCEQVAEAPHGALDGCVSVTRAPWWMEGRFTLRIAVARQARRQGLGARLLEHGLAFARPLGATRLDSEVSDSDAVSLRFAERHGFQVTRHLFASTLEVAAFDEAPFREAFERAAGLRFLTMQDAGDTREARERLWALNRTVSLDIPGREQTFATVEDYIRQNCEASWYRPDAQLIAADGDRWVGLCALQPKGDLLINRITGVVPDYRGRAIATALKLLAVRYARQHGYATVRTYNDAENAPMLAINRKLGYKPEPSVFLLQLNLPPNAK